MPEVEYVHFLLLGISQQLLKNGTAFLSLAQYNTAKTINNFHVSGVQCAIDGQVNATDSSVLLKQRSSHMKLGKTKVY